MKDKESLWKNQIIDLKIPNIQSITPYVLNKNWKNIKNNFLNEIKLIDEEENNFFSEHIMKNLENYALWPCLIYGICSNEKILLNCCIWTVILFQIDDNAVDNNFDKLEDLLDNTKNCNNINRLYNIFLDNDKFTERFKDALNKWFISAKIETEYRNIGFKNIDEYLNFRINNSCAVPWMIIVERYINFDAADILGVDNDIYNNNSITFLLFAHLILSSDMYSVKREFYKKDWINYIYINSKNNNISLQQSVNILEGIIYDYEKKFLKKCDEILLKFNNNIEINKYILSLKVFLSGNLEWCNKCNRYK